MSYAYRSLSSSTRRQASRSVSTQTAGAYGRRCDTRAVDIPAMAEQSHREEMSAAIRAQRERHAVPKTISAEPEPPSEPAPVDLAAEKQKKTLLDRFRGK